MVVPFGDCGHWQGSTRLGEEDVQYVRVFLAEGSYDEMECLVTVEITGETIDLGMYADNGSSPTPSPTGDLLESTGAISTTGTEDTFLRTALSGTLVVGAGGAYFWLALLASHADIQVACTIQVFNVAWRDRIFAFSDNVGAAALPDPVATITAASDSAVPYVGIVKA